jgi:hypothetical protein
LREKLTGWTTPVLQIAALLIAMFGGAHNSSPHSGFPVEPSSSSSILSVHELSIFMLHLVSAHHAIHQNP